jgi:hypothetical protein
MPSRRERLRKLVEVQQQLKALHEMRHAGHLAAAEAAAGEAADLAAGRPGSLSDIFPDLYARRIDAALARQAASLDKAHREAGAIAAATARTNMAARSWREAQRAEDRRRQEIETLEAVERLLRDDGADGA